MWIQEQPVHPTPFDHVKVLIVMHVYQFGAYHLGSARLHFLHICLSNEVHVVMHVLPWVSVGLDTFE